MFLKYLVDLPLDLADKLRKAEETNSLLNRINDSDFLFKDLGSFTIREIKDGSMHFKKSACFDLSPILIPEYEISRKNKDIFYQRTFGCKKREAKLHCGFSENVQCIAFYITSPLGGDFYLYLGPFATDKEEIRYYDPGEPKMIRLISRFFFNRFSTYKEIYTCLIDNQDEFIRSSGKEFTEDLTKFFSIKELPTLKDFKLSLKNVKPSILSVKTRKKEGLFIGTFIFHPQKLVRSKEYFDFECKLWLNNKNQITVIASPKYQYSDSALSTIKNIIKDPEFIDFIDNKINAGLNDYILQTDFANEIYEIFKTKLLLGNI